VTTSAADRFEPGTTATRRDVFGGRIFSAFPHRVVSDTATTLAMALWPGVVGLAPASWIEALRTGDGTARDQLMPQLARGDWQTGPWTWQRTTRLSLLYPDRYFSVHLMFDPGGALNCWYVNFEVPYTRTAIGVDTFDLAVDLIVDPTDLSYRWKDEDEYAQGRRLGVISDTCHKHVELAKDEAVALIERREGPFAEDWHGWRPDPAWSRPSLPRSVLDLPGAIGPQDDQS
jgi:hypothetical protein